MSVPVNKRKESKLEVAVKANQLSCYTIQITQNEKVFDPKYYTPLTSKIVDTAISIFSNIWTANNTVVDNHDDYISRMRLQKEAVIQCNSLLSLIQIAAALFHLTSKRVKYWGNLVIDVRTLIIKWHKSDLSRYSQYK